MSENYTIEIVEKSRELSKKESVMLKTNSATRLDELCPVTLEGISGYAVLNIHNPMAHDNKDYVHFVVITEKSGMFYTGSKSFMDNFRAIWSEMKDEKDWALTCYKQDSKKYAGKQFMTCNLV